MNSKIIKSPEPVLMLLLLALLLIPAHPASAQWWRFGTDAAEPVFTDILFNQISVINADSRVQFSREDLDSGKVVVRGRSEIGQGAIGRIEASLDGGTTWQETSFSDRGLFAFEFIPELERTYRFRIRALSTTGRSSDETAHAFDFRLVSTDARAQALEALEELIRRYANRDRSGFMELVSGEFVGNHMALDSALSNDFRYFDAIRIRPTVQRVADLNGRWSIYFSFIRQVRSVRSGQMFQDQANTSVVLIRDEDGYKLHELAAPLIFGLSDPSNIATFVTSESVGKNIITLDQNGTVEKKTQGQAIEASQAIEAETSAPVTLRTFQMNIPAHPPAGFDFANNVQIVGPTPAPGEFFVTGGDSMNGLWSQLNTGVTICDLGPVGIESVTEAPAAGYSTTIAGGYLRPLRTYAFKLANNKYALMEITQVDDSGFPTIIADFNYKYQPNGSRNF